MYSDAVTGSGDRFGILLRYVLYLIDVLNIKRGGAAIKTVMGKTGENLREELLTGALCQALIVKKGVSVDRVVLPEMKKEAMQCPSDCHACCKMDVTLDLTSVESLVIYLLNRDVIDLIEEYTRLHDATGYCPFMIMEKCIINAYKPSACQMYMPFASEGKPMCFYLARGKAQELDADAPQNMMNSSCYDIHGLMLLLQCDVDRYLSRSFFKNIYEGTLWWKDNYLSLPRDTRICLESILAGNYIGSQLTDNFNYKEVLQAGYSKYTDVVASRQPLVS